MAFAHNSDSFASNVNEGLETRSDDHLARLERGSAAPEIHALLDQLSGFVESVNGRLIAKEKYLLTYLNQTGINQTYYLCWMRELNRCFPLLVKLKRRHARYFGSASTPRPSPPTSTPSAG